MENIVKHNIEKEHKKFQFVEVIPFNDNLKLSLKSSWICSYIQARLHDILSVHLFQVEALTLFVRSFEE